MEKTKGYSDVELDSCRLRSIGADRSVLLFDFGIVGSQSHGINAFYSTRFFFFTLRILRLGRWGVGHFLFLWFGASV